MGRLLSATGGVSPAAAMLSLVLALVAPSPALAYGPDAHRAITNTALNVLVKVDSDAAVEVITASNGTCTELPPTPLRYFCLWMKGWPYDPLLYELALDEFPASTAMQALYDSLPNSTKLREEVVYVDLYRDLELVDVEDGKDDPHVSPDDSDNDDPSKTCSLSGGSLTFFCHFIDIKDGPGEFDDYDGYAYHEGSASRQEYQTVVDSQDLPQWIGPVLRGLGIPDMVDSGYMWWYNDEYAHAPGHKWYNYRMCSPNLERYSFPQGQTVAEECSARFPRAEEDGAPGKGIPYSVFPPIDNMARYWYQQFLSTRDVATLGPVLHAIQDASVPHHAAGYLGNWHGEYEEFLENTELLYLCTDAEEEAAAYVEKWSAQPEPGPDAFPLQPQDWQKTPSIHWPVEQLVTWIALNAYHEYDVTYDHFKKGFAFDATSARKLVVLATAMSALVLRKAAGPEDEDDGNPFIAISRYREAISDVLHPGPMHDDDERTETADSARLHAAMKEAAKSKEARARALWSKQRRLDPHYDPWAETPRPK